MAQALLAASATVAGKEPHSLHAYFVESGNHTEPLVLSVDRVRDGRSFSTRRVTVAQGERPLLVALVSFHASGATAADPEPVVVAPGPDELPRLQHWVAEVASSEPTHAARWIEQPPPLELRIGEPPSFLTGRPGTGPRPHWMRLPRAVGDDPRLHAALLAYASDYLLLDMAFRAHPARADVRSFAGVSLDHGIWVHRPARLDRWHVHVQEAVTVRGDRGLARGAIRDEDGHLVATVMQEVLVRPAP